MLRNKIIGKFTGKANDYERFLIRLLSQFTCAARASLPEGCCLRLPHRT